MKDALKILGAVAIGVLLTLPVAGSKPPPDRSAEIADLQAQLAAVTAERDAAQELAVQRGKAFAAAAERASLAEAKLEAFAKPISAPQLAAVPVVYQPAYQPRGRFGGRLCLFGRCR